MDTHTLRTCACKQKNKVGPIEVQKAEKNQQDMKQKNPRVI